MLTVEQIRKILEQEVSIENYGLTGFVLPAPSSIAISGLEKAARAIHEAQGPVQEKGAWVEVEEDDSEEAATEYLRLESGRLYRTRMWRNHAVSLCFVPGEGCGLNDDRKINKNM